MAAWHAAKMMVPAKQGLIVNVSSAGGLRYLFNVAYGVGKAAVSTPPSLTTFPPPLPSLTPFPPPLPSLTPFPPPLPSLLLPPFPLPSLLSPPPPPPPLPFLTPSPPFPCPTYLYYYIVHWKLFQWFLPVSATLLRHYPIIAELSTGSMINKLRCSQPPYRNILTSPRRTEWLQTWLWNYANRTWRVSLCGQELWKLRLWRTWFSAKRIKEERYSLIINAMF